MRRLLGHVIGHNNLIMLLHFSRVLYSLLILIFFSIADPDTDSQTANYAPSINSLDDGIRKVKFDSDPDYGTSNLAPPPDLLDHSSLAAPVLLSDAGCGQDINGKTDKGQSCTNNHRQPPQGSTTGQTDRGMEEAGQQAPIIPQGVPYVTKLGTLERDPSICPYPQRQVPVCSRYDVADLVGSTYVLQACGPCKFSFFPRLATSSRENYLSALGILSTLSKKLILFTHR